MPADKKIFITPTIAMTDYPFPRTQAETDNKTTHNERLTTEKGTCKHRIDICNYFNPKCHACRY